MRCVSFAVASLQPSVLRSSSNLTSAVQALDVLEGLIRGIREQPSAHVRDCSGRRADRVGRDKDQHNVGYVSNDETKALQLRHNSIEAEEENSRCAQDVHGKVAEERLCINLEEGRRGDQDD